MFWVLKYVYGYRGGQFGVTDKAQTLVCGNLFNNS